MKIKLGMTFLLGLMVLGWVWGCAKKIPDDQKTDDVLLAEASELFQNEDYELAIQKYQTLKGLYPLSSHVIEAEFQIGESYFRLKKWPEAVSSFESFDKLHPRHEKTELALFKIGLSYKNDAPAAIDRDQKNLEKALKVFTRLINEYPDGEQINPAKEESVKIRKSLATRIIYIGNFYYKRKKWNAALDRFKDIASSYADMGFEEEMFIKIGVCYRELHDLEKAKQVLSGYLKNYPSGKYVDQAQKILEKIGDTP